MNLNFNIIGRLNSGGAGVSAEYQAILDRAVVRSFTAPSAAQQTKQNTFLEELKTAGVWDELDVLYVTRNDVSSGFWRLNWKTPSSFELADVGAGVSKTASGIQGDGTATAANTTFVPSTNAVKYTQNNASVILQVNNNVATGKYSCGVLVSGIEITIAAKWSDNNFYGVVNGAPSSYNTYANSTSVGFYQMIRTSSTSVKLYKNGSQVDMETKSSNGLPAGDMWICARNGASFSTHQIGFFAMGSNLESKASDIYNAWNTYIT